MPDYILGLDLGQTTDPTAVVALRRSMRITCEGLPLRDYRGVLMFQYLCGYIHRLDLGTPYPEIVRFVASLVESPAFGPGHTRLAIDATGVGRAVVDLFLNRRMRCEVVPITITAGDTTRFDSWNNTSVRAWWVPKNELVSAMQALLATGRLKVARVSFAEDFQRELLDFRVRTTESANEVFNAREGAHDDLLLGGSLAAWLGEQSATDYAVEPSEAGAPRSPEAEALAKEAEAAREALKREEEANLRERERAWRDPYGDHWYGHAFSEGRGR